MSGTQDDEPAFPRDHARDGHNGMTLRDYFAAKALNGWLASTPGDFNLDPNGVASLSYEVADAMLKARAK